jgi:hypothetical protein
MIAKLRAAFLAFLLLAVWSPSYAQSVSGGGSIATPVAVANGGTGTANTTGTAFENIMAGVVGNGYVRRTGANNYTFDPHPLDTAHGGTSSTTGTPYALGTITFEQGAGAPSSLTRNRGALFVDVAEPALYQANIPSSAGPARVAEGAISRNSYTVTMNATPTPGNLLVAVCYRDNALPTANTGWTASGAGHNKVSNDPYAIVVTKVAATSDTTSQTPCATTGTSYGAGIVEVSNVEFTTAIQSITYNQASAASGAFTATATGTSSTTNTLGVGFSAWTNCCGGTGHDPGFSLTGTASGNQATSAAGSLGSNPEHVAVGSAAFASTSSSETAIGNSVFTGGPDTMGITSVVVILQPPTGLYRWGQITALKHTSASAGALQLGDADAAAPTAYTAQVQSVTTVPATSNTAGANFTLAGSRGTGTGAGGSLIFRTAPAGSTGSAVNPQVTAMTVDANTHVSFGGTAPAVTSCGTSPSIVGSDTAGEVTTGTATPTACTITFNKAYAAQPYCTVADRSTQANLTSYTVSTTAIVLTNTAASSQKIAYNCFGA